MEQRLDLFPARAVHFESPQLLPQKLTTMSGSELANAQNESIWSVTLDPVSDEGPFDIHVKQPLTNGTLVTITIHDVLFGDVWMSPKALHACNFTT